jgi:hypothetical protein
VFTIVARSCRSFFLFLSFITIGFLTGRVATTNNNKKKSYRIPMPIIADMQRIQKQEQQKAGGVILGALDRAAQKIDTTIDKGRDAVANVFDKAATQVEQWNVAAHEAGDAIAAAAGAALGNDTGAVKSQTGAAGFPQSPPAKQQSAPEDDEDVSASPGNFGFSPTTGVKRRSKIRVKSPEEIKADMKRKMEKVKQKLHTFAENVRGPSASPQARRVDPSDAFLGPDLSPKSLAAKRRKQKEAAMATSPTSPPAAAPAGGGAIQNFVGSVGSVVKEAVNAVTSPLVTAGHVTRTLNDVLPQGTIPEAVMNLLPPSPEAAGLSPSERAPRRRFSKIRQWAKRIKLGVYLVKNPQVIKTIAIAGAVLIAAMLMGTGALVMHLIDRRMMLRD